MCGGGGAVGASNMRIIHMCVVCVLIPKFAYTQVCLYPHPHPRLGANFILVVLIRVAMVYHTPTAES